MPLGFWRGRPLHDLSVSSLIELVSKDLVWPDGCWWPWSAPSGYCVMGYHWQCTNHQTVQWDALAIYSEPGDVPVSGYTYLGATAWLLCRPGMQSSIVPSILHSCLPALVENCLRHPVHFNRIALVWAVDSQSLKNIGNVRTIDMLQPCLLFLSRVSAARTIEFSPFAIQGDILPNVGVQMVFNYVSEETLLIEQCLLQSAH